MKKLLEISKIVTLKKVKKLDVLDDSILQKNTKTSEFYEGLTSKKFKTDRNAAYLLYQSDPQDPNYRKLKSRFRQRLLNSLFFIEPNNASYSNYDKVMLNWYKEWAQIQILLANGAKMTAASMLKHIFRTALKFQSAELIVKCARKLRELSAETGDLKDFDYYNNYIEQYKTILHAELKSEELLQKMKLLYSLPKSKIKNQQQKLNAYCDETLLLSENHDSPVVSYNMFVTWILRYEMENEFEMVIEIIENAEDFVNQNLKLFSAKKILFLSAKKMSIFLHIQDYQRGKNTAEKYISTIPSGEDYWFSFMEHYLLLSLHSNNYYQAIAIYNRVINNVHFKKLEPIQKEKWVLISGYLHFLIKYHKESNINIQKKREYAFNEKKFVQKNPKHSPDHRILTIHEIVLQCLFLMLKKDYKSIEEKLSILNYIVDRKFKREDNSRAVFFIKLLQALKRADFKKGDLSNIDKYYSKLRAHHFHYHGEIRGLEILPFESLWTIFLDLLNE